MQVQEQATPDTNKLFNVNPLQWHDAISMASEFCADLAAKGCHPQDAVKAYGLHEDGIGSQDWDKAAQRIALMLSSPAHQRPC